MIKSLPSGQVPGGSAHEGHTLSVAMVTSCGDRPANSAEAELNTWFRVIGRRAGFDTSDEVTMGAAIIPQVSVGLGPAVESIFQNMTSLLAPGVRPA
ncbi:MAG: hypothetical protein ACK55I_11045, partial [bacterium]